VALSDKPLVWLHAVVRSPPFSPHARVQAGFMLRRLQGGEKLALPHSRPLPSIGGRCHELRINDVGRAWRIVYRIDADAIVIAAVFEKKGRRMPAEVIATCRSRLRAYDAAGDA
jgi:phage-related protein